MVKHIEGAGHIQLQGRRNALGLRLRLAQKLIIEVLQDGHFLRVRVSQVRPVHIPHRAVNDGLFHRLQSVLAPHHNIAQGEDEVGFQSQRVIIVRIVEVDVHWVHILVAGGRNFHHLSAQADHQRGIFVLRVTNQNIIIRHQEHIGNLAFCREGLTTARCAEYQTVGVLQEFSVHHNEVVGERVQPIVQGLFAILEKLLGGKGYKNSDA